MLTTLDTSKRTWIVIYREKATTNRRCKNWINAETYDEAKLQSQQWPDMGALEDIYEVNPNTGIRLEDGKRLDND